MIPSATFAKSRRVGTRASCSLRKIDVIGEHGEVDSRLIHLMQRQRAIV